MNSESSAAMRSGRKNREEKGSGTEKKKKRCPYIGRCGGCSEVSLPYTEQIRRKQAWVEECIGSFGPVESMICMKNPDHYRNKMTAVFAIDYRHGHKPYCGIYEKNSHRVVPVEHCLLVDPRADAICQSILSLLPSFKIQVFDKDRGTGILRYVQVRTARATGQVMVTLVTAGPIFPSKNNFVKALCKMQPEITTIVQNINTRTDSMILGDREKVMFGPGYIEDRLCGRTFRISSRSFYQVNPIQTEKLYNIAIDAARLSGKEHILDAYCGIGTIGICAADRAAEITGVEINPQAVSDAKINAALNFPVEGEQAKFHYIRGDAGKLMVQMAEEGNCPDVVFMDPPRAGASEDFLNSLLAAGPRRVVYISCNPVTLGRDLKILCRAYRMEKAVPLDMFPATGKAETVCLLSKLNGMVSDR